MSQTIRKPLPPQQQHAEARLELTLPAWEPSAPAESAKQTSRGESRRGAVEVDAHIDFYL